MLWTLSSDNHISGSATRLVARAEDSGAKKQEGTNMGKTSSNTLDAMNFNLTMPKSSIYTINPRWGISSGAQEWAAYAEHMVQASLFWSEQASLAAASCMAAISSSSGVAELDLSTVNWMASAAGRVRR